MRIPPHETCTLPGAASAVATKHIVSLENRFPSFILKKGACSAKLRKTRDAGLSDFARLPAAPDQLGNQHEEQRTYHHQDGECDHHR